MNTTDTKSTETRLILLHLYTSIIFHSLANLNKNTDSHAAMVVSRASDSAAICPRFEPRPLTPLLRQNLGTCATYERIGKKKNSEPCDITIAYTKSYTRVNTLIKMNKITLWEFAFLTLSLPVTLEIVNKESQSNRP